MIIEWFRGSILAYHDRSDGGLLTVLCEMAFCSRVGLNIHFDVQDSEAFLFNEELGAVIEIRSKDLNLFTQHAFNSFIHPIGSVEPNHDNVVIRNKSHIIFNERVIQLQEAWSRTSIEIQKLRGSIECADTEYSMILDEKFKGLSESILFPLQNPRFFQNKPWVAVLRDQGINGHVELAFAFYKAGFEVIDVHMTDLLKKRVCLDDFYGLACPGGFSYGDVLGILNLSLR